MTEKDEWVQYSTPFEGGAEYIAVCLPAFSPDTVKRDIYTMPEMVKRQPLCF